MRFILYSVEPKVVFSTNLLSDCITQCIEEVLKYLLVLQAMTFEHFLTSQLFNKLIHVLWCSDMNMTVFFPPSSDYTANGRQDRELVYCASGYAVLPVSIT